MADYKNIRLYVHTWEKLRELKFEGEHRSYNEMFKEIFEALEDEGIDLKEFVTEEFKEPYEKTDEIRNIIVDKDVHRRLGYYKMQLMRATGATARGEGSVSISQIVEKLIRKYSDLN